MDKEQKNPTALTSFGGDLHNVIIKLLENEKTGRLLDAPAGEGALCKKCKRTILYKEGIGEMPEITKDVIYYDEKDRKNISKHINSKRLKCPNCNSRIAIGVRDRVEAISTKSFGSHPSHRPKYLKIAPLLQLIAVT